MPRCDGTNRRRGPDIGTAPTEHAGRRVGQLGVDLRQNARARLEQVEAEFVATQAGIVAQNVVGKGGQFPEQLDTDQPSTDDDDCEIPAPKLRIRRHVGPFQALDQMVPQDKGVRHGLEREGARRAGNQVQIRRGAQCHDEMVVGKVIRVALGGDGVHHAPVDIHALDVRLHESRAPQGGPNGLGAVPELQGPGARLEEQWREHEEIVAAHQGDLDTGSLAAQSLEVAGDGHASEPTTQHHDPRSRRPARPGGRRRGRF